MSKLSDELFLIDGRQKLTGIKRPPFLSQRKMYEKKVQYMDMADMKLEGKTLEEIGDKYKCTRENVRQKLSKYFPDIEFPNFQGKKHPPSKYKMVNRKCETCKKPMKFRGTPSMIKKRFCNSECFGDRDGVKYRWSKMNYKQRKEANLEKTMNYYNKHKNDPHFKAKIKEYNRRASIKLKQKNEKVA